MSFLKIVELERFDTQIECLDFLLDKLADSIDADKLRELKNAVYEREDTASTFLGDGIAVPHGRVYNLGDSIIIVGVSREGIDWPSEDKRANLIFLIGVDNAKVSQYLALLQKIIKWRKSLKIALNELDPKVVETQLGELLL